MHCGSEMWLPLTRANPTRAAYIPLRDSDSNDHCDRLEHEGLEVKAKGDGCAKDEIRAPSQWAWAISLAFCISLISAIINITAITFRLYRDHFITSPVQRLLLQYPNQYVGLENVAPVASAEAIPIINFPLVIAQINSSSPGTVYLENNHWPSGFGMIYPEDKQFLVNTKVSTILQFRVLDYGMERCTLTFSLPTPEGLADPHHSKAVALGGPIHLSIWRLDSSEPLEPSSLSWSNRPPRRRDAMEFYVQPEGSLIESEEFRCPAGSLQTYEVACSPRNSDCYIWFQQDHKEPRLALYLTQKQSKPPSL